MRKLWQRPLKLQISIQKKKKKKMKMVRKILQIIFLIAILVVYQDDNVANSVPLSTRSRWIIDGAAATERRVKLQCINWAGHMEAMIAEGLDRKPLKEIAGEVASLGFNCVRLTWATFMFTKSNYSSLTVAQNLNSLNLSLATSGMATNNPSLLNLTVIEAYDAVVEALGAAGLMVVLDNHVSQPQWCCGEDDGNGFFGDTFFNPNEWLRGLAIVAQRFEGKSQVVGMSLRNELRGPRQSEMGWYHYIQLGATTVHKANPDVLVIVSGLSYSTDLSFLKKMPLGIDLDNKLVYETHWYSFTNGEKPKWEQQSPEWDCANFTQQLLDLNGFVTQGNKATPLFVSEFGVDQRMVNTADDRFLSCFLAFAAKMDVDWALWALQGSYYLRNGIAGFEETYGVLDADWDKLRNPHFVERFRLINMMLQDPGSNGSSYNIIYHPLSGDCIEAGKDGSVRASDCQSRSKWSYNGDGSPIWLMGTTQCLRVAGKGLTPILSTNCTDSQSNWKMVSNPKFQVAALDAQGTLQCLERSSSNSAIITNQCLCLDDSACDSETQWFSFVSSNIM